MSYTENSYELCSIKRNDRGEYVVATKIESRGKEYLDIRQYYTADDDSVRPTKKGIRINTESAKELLRGCLQVLEEDELEDLIEELRGES